MNKHVRITRTDLAHLFGVADDRGSSESPWSKGRMYAICFDLDTDALARHYHGASPNNGYDEIRRVLEKHGFDRVQGSVYFGNKNVTPVTCVMAIQSIQAACPWFGRTVRDIRMLRIEENNDLMPAIAELELFDESGAPIAVG